MNKFIIALFFCGVLASAQSNTNAPTDICDIVTGVFSAKSLSAPTALCSCFDGENTIDAAAL